MPHRRSALPLAALLAAVALLTSACSLTDLPGPGRDDQATPPTHAHRAAGKPGPAWATGAPVRVVMNDHFRYRPSAIMVRAGRRVTFAVTNAGKLPHEFILGDRATQLTHERRMQEAAAPTAGGHIHVHAHGPADHASHGGHGASALTVPPGQTGRLTWAFHDPGIVLYGCHVLGHWAAGMRGTIVVLAPTAPCPSRPCQPSTAEPDTSPRHRSNRRDEPSALSGDQDRRVEDQPVRSRSSAVNEAHSRASSSSRDASVAWSRRSRVDLEAIGGRDRLIRAMALPARVTT